MIQEKYYYLLIDFFTILFPFLFSFHKKWNFKNEWKYFFAANAFVVAGFVIWDSIFTAKNVWGFNERYILGADILNLPVEEVLFFICIPYACVFSYYCFGIIKNHKIFNWDTRFLSGFLILVLLVTAIIHHERLYTFYNSLFTAMFIAYTQFVKNKRWLPQLYVTYAVMLLPFFVVNGLLTGTGIEEPIVRYNSHHILNIRLLTIPVEDVFYGFLMIGINVYLYEFLRNKKKLAHKKLKKLF